MEFIKGYLFDNKNDAIQARERCDVFYGMPVNANDVTQHWCDYQFAALQGFYYIIFDESLLPVLGEPQDIEIITKPI